MRRALIGIAIAIVVLIIAVFVAVSLVNVNRFRPQIEAELESKLNRPVTLGRMHLHIFPLSIQVDGITIGEPAGFPANPPFVHASKVSASASLGSILGGTPEIHNLTLTDPHVELIQNAKGVWNFSNIGPPPAEKPAPSATQPRKSSAQPPVPGPAQKPAKAVPFTLKELKILDGQVAVTDERTKAPRTVYNHIDLTLTNFAPDQQFDIAASIHFPGPGTELLSFNGKGGPLATGPGQIIPVNGRVSLREVSLASFHSVAPGTLPANADASMSGGAAITTMDKTIACKGDVTLNNPTVQGKALKHPIAAKYDISLNEANDRLVIHSGTISTASTAVKIAGTMDMSATAPPADLQLSTKDASVSDLLEVASMFGVAPMGNTMDGTLGAQARLHFALESGANIARTLNGTLNFALTDGHFKNVNILNELARVGKFLKAAPSQSANNTVLKRLAGAFDIRNGVATTNNLAATLDLGSLAAKGSLNLVNEALNMHMTAVLASGISKTVGGTGIGGFLNTALANNKGELVLPVIVTGTMSHPVFAPDVQQIAQMKIKHLLPTAEDPGSILGSLLGGSKSGNNTKKQSPLNSIFKALGKH